MSDSENNADIIEIAFDEMKRSAVPIGPSDDLLHRASLVVRTAAARKAPRPWPTIAAAALLAIGTTAILLILRSPQVTYADVMRKITDARLVKFDDEISTNGGPARRITCIVSNDG